MSHIATALYRQLAIAQKRTSTCLRATHHSRLIRPTVVHRFNLPGHPRTLAAQPKAFPTVGFEILPADELVEEEDLPNYAAERYYPAQIGEVLQDRYQITAKLGCGGGSTVWICRDLKEDKLLTIKICTTGKHGIKDALQEMAVSDHINSIDEEIHPGRQRVRTALDNFEMERQDGKRHHCLIFPPLGLPLTEFRKFFPDSALDPQALRLALLWTIMGLDFLHQVGVVHTDLSPNNILVGFGDGKARLFEEIERLELATPSPRKVLQDRSIYLSYQLPKTHGPVVITDFGAARLGDPGTEEKHPGDVMPGTYRAPEIIMGANWDSKIDMWSLGVMVWDLLEGGSLFRAVHNNQLNDEVHLAEMVSLLGPPPKEFLRRHQKTREYWDSKGNWIGSYPIPDQSLESREKKLEGEEKQQLLAFVRKLLCWLPEDRKTAEELYFDDFLKGCYKQPAGAAVRDGNASA